MRRWRESAARARRYACARRSRRKRAGVALRFVWLRRMAASAGGVYVALHTRFTIGVALRVQPGAPRRRDAARPPMTRGTRETVRYGGFLQPIVRPSVVATHETVRQVTDRGTYTIIRDRRTPLLLRGQAARESTAARSAGAIITRSWVARIDGTPAQRVDTIMPEVRSGRAIQRTYVQQFMRVTGSHVTRSTERQTVLSRVLMGRRPARDAAKPVPLRRAALPLPVVERQGEVSAAATRAFTEQPQPLANPPARPVTAEPVSVERLEKTLRESLTVVAERTVQRELHRTLAPGAPLNRRLRDAIQSEMYDDIVFERERRGAR